MWEAISYYIVLALESLVGIFGVRLYEEPRYDVIERIGERVEIRRYASRLAAEVELPDSGESGRNEAFQLLFAYIAGANRTTSGVDRIAMTAPVAVIEAKERIAMTVPVQTSARDGTLRMQFFLPAKFTRYTAPDPMNSKVRLVTIPAETIAILRFSGSGRDFAERQAELIAALAGLRWQPTGAAYTLFYDAPLTLPQLRRNEAAVAVMEK